jgi:hypothetical protein
MVKLIQEDDFRDENCALRLINRDLELAVKNVNQKDTLVTNEDSSIVEPLSESREVS